VSRAKTPRTTISRTRTEPVRKVGFGLGANLGDARGAIARAIELLGERVGPLDVAPLYLSEPVSEIPQPDFLNTVAVASTALPAGELLVLARGIERRLGRRRREKNASREIDVDLLFAGDERIAGPGLVLPHPRLRERRFVLAPLADLLPDLPLPPDGATPRALLARLSARPWARRVDNLADPA
jgi:2-amino-4-hydroxy-6-hydroxymethyldihydropteridine diphosphokinase